MIAWNAHEHWLPCGSPVAPWGGRGFLMPIRISDGIMHLEIDVRVVATATERSGGWWEVTYWPRFFDRNQYLRRVDFAADGYAQVIHRATTRTAA